MSSNHLKWLLCDPISEYAVCSRPRTVGIFLAPSLGIGRRWFCLFFWEEISYITWDHLELFGIFGTTVFVTIWNYLGYFGCLLQCIHEHLPGSVFRPFQQNIPKLFGITHPWFPANQCSSIHSHLPSKISYDNLVILGSCLTILSWYSMQRMVGLCPRNHQNVTAALVTLVGRVHLCPGGRTDPLVFIAIFGMLDDRPLPKTLHWSRVVLFDKGNQKHPGHNVPRRPGR